jgi:hypothetical protein
MTRSQRPVQWSAKVYAASLHFYPAAFRRDYAREMTLVFGELANDAWNRAGWLGLMGVWFRVVVDLARTVPHEHYLAWNGGMQMKTVSPVKTVGLAALSIAVGAALNVAFFGLFNELLWLGWVSGSLHSYEHWPPSYLPATLATLLPPFFTGFAANMAKPFYRPYLTAPVGPMMFAAALSFADPRSPWLLSFGYPTLVGAAALLGCYLSTRIWRRRAAACQELG